MSHPKLAVADIQAISKLTVVIKNLSTPPRAKKPKRSRPYTLLLLRRVLSQNKIESHWRCWNTLVIDKIPYVRPAVILNIDQDPKANPLLSPTYLKAYPFGSKFNFCIMATTPTVICEKLIRFKLLSATEFRSLLTANN